MKQRGATSEEAAFSQTLAALKRRGSNLLVVSGCQDAPHDAACTRLLGESGASSRQRLFVITDGDDATDRLTDEEGRRTVVSRPAFTRSSAATSTGESVIGPDTPAELGRRAVSAIDELERESDGFDPAELRVCVDSLASLLASHDEQAVTRMVQHLTDRIERADGMGHFHLPSPLSNDSVQALQPLFDAVIEVRRCEDHPEQRWHLPELTSGWLPL